MQLPAKQLILATGSSGSNPDLSVLLRPNIFMLGLRSNVGWSGSAKPQHESIGVKQTRPLRHFGLCPKWRDLAIYNNLRGDGGSVSPFLTRRQKSSAISRKISGITLMPTAQSTPRTFSLIASYFYLIACDFLFSVKIF